LFSLCLAQRKGDEEVTRERSFGQKFDLHNCNDVDPYSESSFIDKRDLQII